MQLNITHFHKQNQKRNVKIVAEGDFQKTFKIMPRDTKSV